MKFTLNSLKLKKQLKSLEKAVDNSSILPILSCFLLSTDKGNLTVSSSNRGVLISATVKGIVSETLPPAAVAVSADKLMKTLDLFKDQDVIFTMDTVTLSLHMKSNEGTYKIAGEEPSEFPTMKELENPQSCEIPSSALTTAINTTMSSITNNEYETSIYGMCCEFKEGKVCFTTSDKVRLAHYEYVNDSIKEGQPITIPKVSLTALRNAIPDYDNVFVVIESDATSARFSFLNMVIQCITIEDKFPDYTKIIPKGHDIIVSVNRIILSKAIKRSIIYCSHTAPFIKCVIKDGVFQIFSEDIDFSNHAEQTLPCIIEGEGEEAFIIDPVKLFDNMNHLNCDNVQIKITRGGRILLFHSDKEEEASKEFMLMCTQELNTNGQ